MKDAITSELNIDRLYADHVHELYSYALHLGFRKDIIEDAIHDVYYNVCIGEDRLTDIVNMRFYLMRSLKNRLLNIHKQNKETIEYPDGNDANELPFTIRVTVEDAMIQHEDDECIRLKVEKLLKSLTDRQREIIYLRFMQNLDYEQISEMMNITVPACRKLLHKAITKLRAIGDPMVWLILPELFFID
jgi:RNA polymerase sigma factor (sigma-70 family)